MKAIVLSEYGSPDVLRFTDVEQPTAGDGEVLVRVRAASVNPYDWHLMRGEPIIARAMGIGLRRPKYRSAGADMAGEVETVGPNVTRFRPGDAVYALLEQGAFAEYVCVKEDALVPKPANLTFEEAAAIPLAGKSALTSLREIGRIRPGQRVLVNGASGGIGTFAVQLARALGAEVTGVCSGPNVELVQAIGAKHVIDYTREDFTAGDQRYDLMLDTVGSAAVSRCRRVLAPKATYVAIGGPGGRWLGPVPHVLGAPLLSPFVSQTMVRLELTRYRDHQEIFGTINDFIEAGQVTPVIDRTYTLSEVPEAIRYLEGGHARGKVAITV